ncbi:MAG: hypothetical protein C5B54_06175 [Acidobacteria bacterium]|nr:MAG: hypothetical protein C5B54_06175 [Acidobacteriota bacterium]
MKIKEIRAMKRISNFLMMSFAFLNFAYAEGPAAYSMDDCVQQALEHNPAAAYAKESELAAREDVETAKGKYYPDVGLEAGYRRFATHVFLPEQLSGPAIPPTVGPINDYRLGLRANYSVYDSGLRSSDMKTAEATLASSQEESNRTRADIVYRAQAAFYEVLQAQDGVDLAKSQAKRSQDHLRLAEERKTAGAVPQADVTRSRTEVASAQLDVASAESTLRIALGKLNEAMGRNASDPLEIAKPALVPPDPNQINIQESIQKAIASRPEILAAQKRVEAKRSQIGSVQSDNRPKVNAEAGYGWRDDNFKPPDKDWWVGVTLNVPIFDGGARSHRIAKSKIEANKEAQQLEQTKLSIQQEVWTAYSQWIEAYQALQTSGVMKSEAAESLNLINARYEEGASTISDLLDAELAASQSEVNLNNAQYQVHIAHAAFLRSAGLL